MDDDDPSDSAPTSSTAAQNQLKNAANIGTALMLVNSHRALFLLYVHTAMCFSFLFCLSHALCLVCAS